MGKGIKGKGEKGSFEMEMERTSGERPRVALTMGDPNGIGPEIILKTLADAALMRHVRPVVIGSKAVLERHAAKITDNLLPTTSYQVVEVDREPPAVRFGEITEAGGRFAMRAVERATDLCLDGAADAMVTAPLSKEAIRRAGYANPGHTEFIAGRAGCADYAMMMVAEAPEGGAGPEHVLLEGALRVALVTAHVPLRVVAEAVTCEAILGKLRVVDRALRQDFGIAAARIAVLGPTLLGVAGGALGGEEACVLAPALEAARARGLDARGPFPADGFFGLRKHVRYDAVLAMYHDQGLVPFKALAFEQGVNYTAGLPLVRTSPDHGTAFDIAGRGAASPESMKSAVRLAAAIARRRREQTSPA